MTKNISILFLMAMSLTISCAQDKKEIEYLFDEENLLGRMEILSSDQFEGRQTGQPGNDSARAYIINEFKALGINGYEGNFEQTFTFKRRKDSIEGVNILAEIKGKVDSEKYIVISAHYDHLGMRNNTVYNGADDNASGVSAMLTFAEYLVENPPKHSIIFAGFDAEEIGLQGAKHFVKTIDKEKVVLNINMDMISRSPANELYVVGSRYNDSLKNIIEGFENPTTSKLLVGHDGTDGKQDWTWSSDHGPFYKIGIPFLYFGNEDHEAYHRSTDDFEDITPEFYLNAVEIILSVLIEIDNKGL